MLWGAPPATPAEEPATFRPLAWLHNPHVQTFLGAYWPGPTCPPARRYVVWLPDGDGVFLDENTPRGWKPGDPMALLLHGLGGSSNSPHIQRMAVLLLQHGVRVVRMNQRGAGEGVSLARGVYHGGRSADVRAALAFMHRSAPHSPLWLAGVSLGGALALRTACEIDRHPIAGLERVAAICPPVDLGLSCAMLDRPANRVYCQMFLRIVAAEARQRRRYFPDLPRLRLPPRATFGDFDELYTAPRSGFTDADDYYRTASAAPLMSNIPIPAFILTSRDDPFVVVEQFNHLTLPMHAELRIVEHGGHVGFVGPDRAGGVRWAERRLVEWLCR